MIPNLTESVSAGTVSTVQQYVLYWFTSDRLLLKCDYIGWEQYMDAVWQYHRVEAQTSRHAIYISKTYPVLIFWQYTIKYS